MTPKKKITIASIAFVILSAILIVLAVIFNGGKSEDSSSNEPDQASYSDPYSGETVLNPEGKVPEGATTTGGKLVVLGLSKAIDYGLSLNQSDQVKEQLLIYSETGKIGGQPITEVSFASDSFTQKINSKSGERTLNAKLRINRSADYSISMVYVGSYDMLVKIYDARGKQVFITPYDD